VAFAILWPRLGLTEDLRTTDFQLGLFNVVTHFNQNDELKMTEHIQDTGYVRIGPLYPITYKLSLLNGKVHVALPFFMDNLGKNYNQKPKG